MTVELVVVVTLSLPPSSNDPLPNHPPRERLPAAASPKRAFVMALFNLPLPFFFPEAQRISYTVLAHTVPCCGAVSPSAYES